MITGHIFGDEQPLVGVAVSNGFDIVRTDAAGRYELPDPTADYPFVFVNLPAGWASDGPFFQRVDAARAYDFRLRSAPQRARDSLRLVHITDPHIGAPPKRCFATSADLTAALQHVIVEAQPDLIVITGDLTNLGTFAELEAYRDAIADIATPIVSLTSGHDYLEELDALRKEAPEAELRARHTHRILGVEQYSFDWGPYHILMYPETHRDPTRAARLKHFMAQDLAMQAPHKPVIFITHDPPRAFPEKHPPDYGPSLLDILQHPTVPLVMHGQYHIARVVQHRGAFVIGLPCLLMGAIDTHAPAYGVYDLWDGRATVTLRTMLSGTVEQPSNTWPTLLDRPLKWRCAVAGNFHRATPVIADDMLLMPTSDLGNPAMYGIYAVATVDGATQWFTPTGEVVKNGCVLVGDRAVAVTVAGMVLCLHVSTGEILWQRRLPTYPDRWLHVRPIVADDHIYITNYAIRSCLDVYTGEVLWHHHEAGLFDNAYAAPYQEPILHNSFIWLVDQHFNLQMIDPTTGAIVKRVDLNFTEENRARKAENNRMFQSQIASPIACDGHIIAPGAADQIGLIAGDGELLWLKPVLEVDGNASFASDERSTRPREYACGLTAGIGQFFATSASGDVFCINLADGAVLWRTRLAANAAMSMVPYQQAEGLLLTRPVLAAGYVFVAASDGTLIVLSAQTGEILAKTVLGAPITAPPIITENAITIFTYDGHIWRFE